MQNLTMVNYEMQKNPLKIFFDILKALVLLTYTHTTSFRLKKVLKKV